MVTSGVSIKNALLRRNNYPDKLLSLSDLYLPEKINNVFRLIKYYGLTNETLFPALVKLAESAVTSLEYDTSDSAVLERYKNLFGKKLKLREKLLRASYDLTFYGNAIVSVTQKVQRELVCPYCKKSGKKHRFKAENIDWKFKSWEFHGKCPTCKNNVKFIVEDKHINSPEMLRVLVLDPFEIDIEYYPIIDKKVYYYIPSRKDRLRVMMGDKEYISELPMEIINSIRRNTRVRLSDKNIFHFFTVTLSNAYNGWGIPKAISVLKAIYYMLTIMRANEATSLGRINDLTVLFPQQTPGGANPISSIGGGEWRRQMESMIENHKMDPNYVGISSFPVGVQSIFGQGRQMLITSEMDLIVRGILGALGVTMDMIYSQSNYSSMAVASRLLANQIELQRERMNEFLDFLVGITNKLFPSKYNKINVRLSEYRTVDDLQETSQLMNMNMNNDVPIVSYSSLLKRFKMDFNQEMNKIADEIETISKIRKQLNKDRTEAAGEASIINTRYQQEQQRIMQQAMAQQVVPQGDNQSQEAQAGGVDNGGQASLENIAIDIAKKLTMLPPEEREKKLTEMQNSNPEMAAYIVQALQMLESQGDGSADNNQEPMPEQLPPRRRGGL